MLYLAVKSSEAHIDHEVKAMLFSSASFRLVSIMSVEACMHTIRSAFHHNYKDPYNECKVVRYGLYHMPTNTFILIEKKAFSLLEVSCKPGRSH